MEKVEKNFVDFTEATRKNPELWKKISQITDGGALKKFFEKLNITVKQEHIEKIMEMIKSGEKNMRAESDKDYY